MSGWMVVSADTFPGIHPVCCRPSLVVCRRHRRLSAGTFPTAWTSRGWTEASGVKFALCIFSRRRKRSNRCLCCWQTSSRQTVHWENISFSGKPIRCFYIQGQSSPFVWRYVGRTDRKRVEPVYPSQPSSAHASFCFAFSFSFSFCFSCLFLFLFLSVILSAL